MTIRLLYPVGNEAKGAVLHVTEDRAKRLILTGYAEVVSEDTVPPKRSKKEKPAWRSKD